MPAGRTLIVITFVLGLIALFATRCTAQEQPMPDTLPRRDVDHVTSAPDAAMVEHVAVDRAPISTATARQRISRRPITRGAHENHLAVLTLQLAAGLVFTGLTYATAYGLGWGLYRWCDSYRAPKQEVDYPTCGILGGITMLAVYAGGTLATPGVVLLAGRFAAGTGRGAGTMLGSALLGGLSLLITHTLTEPDGPFVSSERMLAVAASISFGTLAGAIAGYQLTTDAAMRLWAQPTPDLRGGLVAIGGAL